MDDCECVYSCKLSRGLRMLSGRALCKSFSVEKYVYNQGKSSSVEKYVYNQEILL